MSLTIGETHPVALAHPSHTWVCHSAHPHLPLVMPVPTKPARRKQTTVPNGVSPGLAEDAVFYLWIGVNVCRDTRCVTRRC